MTNNLKRTAVAASQGSGVFDAIEASTGAADAKTTAVLAKTVSGTTQAITSAEIVACSAIHLTGTASGATTMTIAVDSPATPAGLFVVINECGQTVTVEISGQSVTAPTIGTGKIGTFFSDGTNVYPVTTPIAF